MVALLRGCCHAQCQRGLADGGHVEDKGPSVLVKSARTSPSAASVGTSPSKYSCCEGNGTLKGEDPGLRKRGKSASTGMKGQERAAGVRDRKTAGRSAWSG